MLRWLNPRMITLLDKPMLNAFDVFISQPLYSLGVLGVLVVSLGRRDVHNSSREVKHGWRGDGTGRFRKFDLYVIKLPSVRSRW